MKSEPIPQNPIRRMFWGAGWATAWLVTNWKLVLTMVFVSTVFGVLIAGLLIGPEEMDRIIDAVVWGR